MKRSLGQVLFRYLPGALLYDDDAEVLAQVTRVDGQLDDVVDPRRLARAISRKLNWWRDTGGGTLRGIESPIEPQRLRPIRPAAVYWTPYPKEVICRRCQRVANIDDARFHGLCPECHLQTKQLGYVYIHHCGALNYLRPIEQVRCPTHGRRSLTLFDTGRFATSTWRCADCTFERGLGIVPCGAGCETPQALRDVGLTHNLQGAVWNDPWVFFPQTAKFVNLDENQANLLVSTSQAVALARRGAAGQIPAGGHTLVGMVNDAGPRCSNCGASLSANARFCAQCAAPVPPVADAPPDEGESLDSSADLVTYALLRDLPQSRSLFADAARLGQLRSREAVRDLEGLGIADIIHVADFPVTTGAFGYSRFLSQPPATLRGFASTGDTTTVYTDSKSTEAWLVRLSPSALVNWLTDNEVSVGSGPTDADPFGWLAPLVDDERYLTLLHSVSHAVVLVLSELAGLEEASLEEILLPEVAAFAIYSSSSELGALGAVYDQSIFAFADELPRGLETCRFDPMCAEHEGSACVGCLHLVRGCERYNQFLSRATLITGSASGAAGYWSVPR
jgi:hypothetical protein